MLLDEKLRQKIDVVVRRRQTAEWILVSVQGLLGTLAAFVVLRGLLGVITGGAGFSIAFGLAIATGVGRVMLLPRARHTRLGAARYIDGQLGLADRLATAVELSGPGRPRSSVEEWLFSDAASYARKIAPTDLVPFSVPRQAKWIPALLLLSLVLSLDIYPQNGVFWSGASPASQQASQRANELEALAEQLAALDEPEMQKVARELKQVAESLRDKRLPQEQAENILEELEKGLQPSASPTGEQSLGLNTAQVQELASRLRNVETQAGLPQGERISPDALPTSAGMDGTDGQSGSPEQGEGLEANGAKNADDGQSSTDAEGDQSEGMPDESGGGASQAPGQSGQENSSDDTGAGGASTGDEGVGEGFSEGESELAGNMDQPGGGVGSGGGPDGEDPYQRQQDLDRVATRLNGSMEDGSVRTARAQGNSTPGENVTSSTGSSTTLFSSGVEGAVEQENIPAAYRRWVQLYFEALEPGSE